MRFLLVIASCLVAAALPAAEETLPPQDRAAAFRELDRNRDGWISQKEARASQVVASNFKKADGDGDRRLSFAEFETIPLNRSDQPGKFRNPDRG
jgi:hypothetical protein